MKRIALAIALIFIGTKSWACLDCSNTGTEATFTGTVTAQGFAGPTISSMTDRLNQLELKAATNTIVLMEEGSPLSGGQLKAINCVGDAITCTQSNSTGTVTLTATSGASVGQSTRSITMFHSGGPVFIATSTFMAIDGLAKKLTTNTTIWVESIQGYTMYGSSVAEVEIDIKKSTSFASPPTAFLPWGPRIHIATGTTTGGPTYSVTISSKNLILPTEQYSIHISSIPTSGEQARTFGVIINGWEQPLP